MTDDEEIRQGGPPATSGAPEILNRANRETRVRLASHLYLLAPFFTIHDHDLSQSVGE